MEEEIKNLLVYIIVWGFPASLQLAGKFLFVESKFHFGKLTKNFKIKGKFFTIESLLFKDKCFIISKSNFKTAK